MRHDRPFETFLDAAAAAWMAACTAFAVATGAEALGGISPVPVSLGGSVVAALLTFRLLQKVEKVPAALPRFDVAPLEEVVSSAVEDPVGELQLSHDMAVRLPELLLTRAQMLDPNESGEGELLLSQGMAVGLPELLLTNAQMLRPQESREDELLLDDVLVQPQPGSRVVQLFDPSRMPTAGELKERIDRHLGSERRDAPDPQPDASQALYDALADLRRSLG